MKKNGFSLVSVIIGITIMVLGVMAISNLSIASIQANEQSEQRMTAILLAKEGLEGIRNIRDTNWRQNFPWNYRGQSWLNKGDTAGLGYGDSFTQGEINEHLIDPGNYVIEPQLGVDGRSFVLAKASSSSEYQLSLWQKGENYLYRHDELNGYSVVENKDRYTRYLEVTPWEQNPAAGVKVTVHVTWVSGLRQNELTLSTILTNWRTI